LTVVVKLGSSLVAEEGRAREALLAARAAEVAAVVRGGERVCVVSSGAIALGLPRLGLSRRPRDTPRLQAASALGQAQLQRAWDEALRAHGLEAAQILLSAPDLAERATYVNARNALETLLRLGVVPVVNENDATATDEITFGDNDALAAQVAVLVRARLLVLLTEAEGVYSEHPAAPEARLLPEGELADEALLGRASDLGKGGMSSKVGAARLAAAAGVTTVIASGLADEVLVPIVAGEQRGTRFAGAAADANAFRLWLRYAKPVAARIVVDEGARAALVEQGRSLLAVGVARCEGAFAAGDAVEVAGPDGAPFAKALASVGSDQVEGRPRGLEVVHRDRLVLYEPRATRPEAAPSAGV
jgi:glutamate 5-kinase